MEALPGAERNLQAIGTEHADDGSATVEEEDDGLLNVRERMDLDFGTDANEVIVRVRKLQREAEKEEARTGGSIESTVDSEESEDGSATIAKNSNW